MDSFQRNFAWMVILFVLSSFKIMEGAAEPMYGESSYALEGSTSDHCLSLKSGSRYKSSAKKIVCYYAIPNNGSDRTLKNLLPEDIDPHICTHVIVAFADIHNNGIKPKKEEDKLVYKKVLALKNFNPQLKVMLSINGGGFAKLVRNKADVDIFAYNAHSFLVQYGFDGLDLDWEFPAWPIKVGNADQKQQFSYLVTQLYNALKLSSHPPLLLSLAVAAPKTIIRRSYEISILAQNVDFLNVMGYDYRIFWPYLPFTGFNAPLHKRSKEKGYLGTLNIEWTAKYWMRNGAPKEKLVVGIPTYGRTWKLLSFLWNKVGAPAVGQGMLGGALSYPEALVFLKDGAVRKFDKQSKVPYSYMGRNWVSYEDRASIAEKICWIKNHEFGGVMTWNLNSDDYEGKESGRKFDLHHVIKSTLSMD